MLEYVKGVTADKADIVDFGNYVFSQAHRPHNFKTLLPKGYADDRDTTSCHYLAKVDGRIVAVRQGAQLGLAFHPELEESLAVHEMFLAL